MEIISSLEVHGQGIVGHHDAQDSLHTIVHEDEGTGLLTVAPDFKVDGAGNSLLKYVVF